MRPNNTIHHRQVFETGLVFTLMALLAGLFADLNFFYFVATGLLLMILIVPQVFRPLAYVWFGFSKLLSWIMSRILLSVIYYLLVMPVGILRKISGHDRLRIRQFNKTTSSTWETRNHVFQSDDLTHTF
jgi:hypothetical protein